jgi:hypothetical protein
VASSNSISNSRTNLRQKEFLLELKFWIWKGIKKIIIKRKQFSAKWASIPSIQPIFGSFRAAHYSFPFSIFIFWEPLPCGPVRGGGGACAYSRGAVTACPTSTHWFMRPTGQPLTPCVSRVLFTYVRDPRVINYLRQKRIHAAVIFTTIRAGSPAIPRIPRSRLWIGIEPCLRPPLHDGSLTATYSWLLKRPSATYGWSLKTFSDP